MGVEATMVELSLFFPVPNSSSLHTNFPFLHKVLQERWSTNKKLTNKKNILLMKHLKVWWGGKTSDEFSGREESKSYFRIMEKGADNVA